MGKIEFFVEPDGNLYYRTNSFDHKRFNRFDTDIIASVITMIRSKFPDTYIALINAYPVSNGTKSAELYQRFKIADRFLRCNFGENDLLNFDLDNGIYHFEMVRCPLRGGHCPFENVICNPRGRADVKLSKMEKEVASLYAEGITYTDIAECLDKKPNTIKTVLHRIKNKLKLKNSRAIIKEVRINKIL